MKFYRILLIGLIIIIGAACSTSPTETVVDSAVEETAIVQLPSPEPGMATVTGRVFSTTDNAPLRNYDVRLAEVVRVDDPKVGKDVYLLDEAFSPGAITDSEGVFVVESTEAKEYVIIVGDVAFTHEVIKDGSGKALVWNALPDQVLDVGVLEVKLSNK